MFARTLVALIGVGALGAVAVRAAEPAPGGQAPGPQQGPGVVVVESLDRAHDIGGRWRFHPGDDLAWAAPDFDDSGWPSLDVPRGFGVQGQRADDNGHFWYRVTLRAPRPKGNDQPALWFGAVDSAYELYVDGYFIGKIGSVV